MKRKPTIASQIDLAPTLLSLIGVSSAHPMIGRDLARDSDTPGRALLQFDNYFTWLEGTSATILRPGQTPLLGAYDFQHKPCEPEVLRLTGELTRQLERNARGAGADDSAATAIETELDEFLDRFPEWQYDADRARLASTSTVRGWESLPISVR